MIRLAALQTVPLPVLQAAAFSAMAAVAMFALRAFIVDGMLRKAIGSRPVVLVAGQPGAGKGELMRSMSGGRVKTMVYPFIGKIRMADSSFYGKPCRFVCFRSASDGTSLKRHAARLRHNRPKVVLFAIRASSDGDAIRMQQEAFREIAGALPGVASIPVLCAPPAEGVASIKPVTDAFGCGVIDMLRSGKGEEELYKAISPHLA
ncbi:MAG: hypothetical protein HY367_01665 [Candidatus Aenigmarchaeota archaeon]|nr:hypothetical protein [Candidatus Aenigmarchaeota archaeon]